MISVDDHLIEPADLFDGRMPAHLVDRAPRVVELDGGNQAWAFEDALYPNIGLNAVIGRPEERVEHGPRALRRDAQGMLGHPRADRRHGRRRHLGVAVLPVVARRVRGHDVRRARTTRSWGRRACAAWNDWHHEVWAGTYPERIIPLQITWLNDPAVAAQEVRRNAARGFKALSFPENPHHIGLPSMHTDHWDPLLAACEETDTVICLHTGSASWSRGHLPARRSS